MRRRTRNDITEATVLLDKETASSLFSLGQQTLDNLATEAGAKLKIGKRVLYHRGKLEDYFNSLVDED